MLRHDDNDPMLRLAGEFLVAGELLRRHIQTAITCGYPRPSEVVVRDDHHAIVIKIKTTRDGEWSIEGSQINEGQIWILVHLPRDRTAAAEFYILNAAEIGTREDRISYLQNREDLGVKKGDWEMVRKALKETGQRKSYLDDDN